MQATTTPPIRTSSAETNAAGGKPRTAGWTESSAARFFHCFRQGISEQALQAAAKQLEPRFGKLSLHLLMRGGKAQWQSLGQAPPSLAGSAIALVERAAASAALQSQENERGCMVAVPIVPRGTRAETLVACCAETRGSPELLLALQLLASQITIARESQTIRDQQAAGRVQQAVAKIAAGMVGAARRDTFLQNVANCLAEAACAPLAFLGEAVGEGCRLAASKSDSTLESSATKAIEAAMDEVLVWNRLLVWPAADKHSPALNAALSAATAALGANRLIGLPLASRQGEIVAAALLAVPQEITPELKNALGGLGEYAGQAIGHYNRVNRTLAQRIKEGLRRLWVRKRNWVMLALLAVFGLVAALPVSDSVVCSVQLEPVLRRYVVAPFDGSLEETAAQPGDLVAKGEPLATLARREMELELAGLQAEYDRHAKKQDIHLAGGSIAEAQLARLEMQRIDSQRKFLRHQLEQCVIRSPIDGVLVSGDLTRAKDARLERGQTLFEIAPLAEMIAEVAVPDVEVDRVSAGSSTALLLDSAPRQPISGEVKKLHVRSRLVDHQNVFIAEVPLENQTGNLRPGMKGTARLDAGTAPLIWVWLRKPWNAFLSSVGW